LQFHQRLGCPVFIARHLLIRKGSNSLVHTDAVNPVLENAGMALQKGQSFVRQISREGSTA